LITDKKIEMAPVYLEEEIAELDGVIIESESTTVIQKIDRK